MSNIIAISQQQKKTRAESIDPIPEPSITRFIIVGASIMNSTFLYPEDIEELINDSYPDETVEVYERATAGWRTYHGADNIDSILAEFSPNGTTYKTYVLIHLGGNDITANRPYSTDSNISNMIDDYNYMLDAIEAKGFTPILNEISFRNYDETTLLNEQNGALPYNENIIKQINLNRELGFVYSDGTSYWQLYNEVFNNPSWLNADDIHINNIDWVRNSFVSRICAPIFTGITPTRILKDGENLPSEVEYYSAYYLPVEDKTNLQTALNTYGSVRLGMGDYRTGVSAITINSDMKLYGHQTITDAPTINIAAGSSNFELYNLKLTSSNNINFISGSSISNFKIKSIENTIINATGTIIENGEFIDLSNVRLYIDNSASGYFRNNKLIKHKIHGFYPQIVMQGNDTTPSYGNTQLWINLLTPGGYAANIDNMAELKWVNTDSETWNSSNSSPGIPNVTMTNIGKAKIWVLSGGNNGSYKTPSFDIEADETYFVGNKQSSGTDNNLLSGGSSLFVKRDSGVRDYDFSGIGYNLKAHNNNTDVYFNEILNNSEIIDVEYKAAITATILDTEYTPWDLPQCDFDLLPNPTGVNWATDRIGKTDSHDYLQGLIDSDAEIPAGIYYIGSTLNMTDTDKLICAGTGKTAIVGLTDDFPLITVTDENPNAPPNEMGATFDITNLTLQGGSTGIKVTSTGTGLVRWNYVVLNHIIFRDMAIGIDFNRFFGIDNNFFEHLYFINNGNGIKKDMGEGYVATPGFTNAAMTYMDKTVFYDCHWYNNDIAINFTTGRQDNLNAWINCTFDENIKVANFKWEAHSFFANSVIKNTSGTDEGIEGDTDMNFYNCRWENNNSVSTLRIRDVIMEGCTILDNVPLNAGYTNDLYITNTFVTGSIGSFSDAVSVNSIFSGTPTLNKLLVNYKAGVPTTIIDTDSTPYPQLLVTH